ncbi:hypothetical protein QE152_g9345 [Popillia japonica]|uniref:Uncharacterized protein n=1 Tax=Popillia japonica TaxID=7064 RepID=A0AAW1LY01_POPJA
MCSRLKRSARYVMNAAIIYVYVERTRKECLLYGQGKSRNHRQQTIYTVFILTRENINQHQEENIISPTIIAEYEAGEDGILSEVTSTSSAPASRASSGENSSTLGLTPLFIPMYMDVIFHYMLWS